MTQRVEKSKQEWRQRLSPEQYRVTREKATEPPFTGEYNHFEGDGAFACICCGSELFDAATKYDSGSGWPSFREPVSADRVREETDTSHGMVRIEVLCSSCDAHLGHVFEDGPPPQGLRYCVNSAALNFVDRESG